MSKPVHSFIVLVRPRGNDLLPKIAYYEEYNRTGKIGLEIPSFEAGMQSMLLCLPLLTDTVSELRPYANGIGLTRGGREETIVTQEDRRTFDFNKPGWGKEDHEIEVRIYEVEPDVDVLQVNGKKVLGWADTNTLDIIHAEGADNLNGRILREVVGCISRPNWPN